jgi:hypothetical protein
MSEHATALRKAGKNLVVSCIVGAAAMMFAAEAVAAADPVVFTFSTVGDSRQDPKSPDPTTLVPEYTGSMIGQDKIWLQNTKAWSRILRTVQSQKANMLFVNGDMIMGYGRASIPTAWTSTPTAAQVVGSDLLQFYQQYAYWRGMIANMFEVGTYVVPVAGNHEVQCNSSNNGNPESCTSGKHAYVENENAWRANMGDLILDATRFTNIIGSAPLNVAGLTAATAPGAADGDTTDQSQLSYSFDVNTAVGLLHFAVVNTDAVSMDSHAPVNWLANDLAAAKVRGAVKLFVFGHKPAFTYDYGNIALGGTVPNVLPGSPAGLDASTSGAEGRDAFWSVIAQYNATYFCGHEHIPHVDHYADPTGVSPLKPYQVLVGSGGSPFDDKMTGTAPTYTEPMPFVNPTDRSYAWATVRVHQSGAVTLDLYAFDDQFGPTMDVLSIANLQ